jgi:hypothetical protein
MVKKYTSLCLFLSLAIPALSYAAGFTAQVDRSRIGASDTVNLRLELSDSEATHSPDFSELEKSFRITAQEQSLTQNSINGKVSSTTGWNLTLVPNQPGQAVIPPITVETSQGELKTQAIPIVVTEETSTPHATAPQKGVSFIATPDKSEVYKNERVKVTFRLNSARDLRNLQIEPLSVKDAIAESVGKAQVQTKIVNGHEQQELVVSYFITPLKDGNLTIPSLVVHAEAQDPKANASASQDPFDSFFDQDDDGSMAGMQKMMKQFTQGTNVFGGFSPFASMKPVVLASKPLDLKVLPPAAGVNPWLPATSLKITEKWSSEPMRAGEPVTRTLTTDATGIDATQLPSLEDQLHSAANDYKVYPDQPKISSTTMNGQEVSQRSESFTIIPQKDGDIKIPAIQLAWWDTNHHTQRTAELPEETIHVLPGNIPAAKSISQPIAPVVSADKLPPVNSNFPVGMVALFSLFFTMLAVYWFKRTKKLSSLVIPPQENTVRKAVPVIGKDDLKKCATVADLKRFLQLYSQSRWDLPPNSSLPKIFSAAQEHIRDFDVEKATNISKQMEDNLYANQPVNSQALKDGLYGLVFKASSNGRRKEYSGEKLPNLNPS